MGLSRGTFDFARIGGALSGAAAFTVFGIAPAYVMIVCIYALSALLTLGTAPGRRAKGGEAVAEAAAQLSPWSDFREGIRYIWNTPPLLAIVWLAFLFNLTAYSITNGLLPYVAREVYHVDQNGLGWLVASFAFGAFLGAITLSRPNIPFALPRLLVVWGVVWLLLMLAFAQVQSFAAGMICLTLAGFASNIAMVPHSVILLRSSDRRFRGRVLGVRMLAIYSLPLGLLIAGVLIEHIGFRATVTLYAVTGIVFLIVIALRWRIYDWQLPTEDKKL
jgi:predicted MFS family arabinose efflux permease